MDEVDHIVEAWHRERPDLDVTALHVMSRLDRFAGVLADRRNEVFSAHGLAQHEFDVLAALRRSGSPYELTPSQLVERTFVTSGTMTNRLTGLARRRLIRRRPDSADRRVTWVALTALGRKRVDAALTDLVAAEDAMLTSLSTSQTAALARSLQRLLAGAPGRGATD